MKKIYLYAVAIGITLVSCETNTDGLEHKEKEIDYQSKIINQVDVVSLYSDLISTYHIPTVVSNQILLQSFQNHAMDNANFRLLAKQEDYLEINITSFEYILHSNYNNAITQFNYSLNVKEYLSDMIENTPIARTEISNDNDLTIKEKDFLLLCYDINNYSTMNNTDDSDWKKRKTIAFAYGYQKSIAQAIIYAGAVEILNNQI